MNALDGGPGERENAKLLERWFRASQDDPLGGWFEVDGRTGRAWWDVRLRRLWGLAPGEPAPDARRFRRAVDRADRQRLSQALCGSLRGLGRGQLTVCVHTPRGRRWWQLGWSVEAEPHGALGGCVRDITPDVERHARVQLVEGQLLLAADLADIGLLREDPATQQLHPNAAARRMLGLAEQEPLRLETLLPRLHPQDRPGFLMARVAATLGRDEQPQELRCRVAAPDGSPQDERVLLVRQRRLPAPGGLGVLLVALLDVTQQARAQVLQRQADLLTAQRDAAEALAASRTALLAAVSHEVRTPLQAMLLATQRLQEACADAGPGGEACAPWLQVLQEAGTHLRQLVQDLLQGAAQEREAPLPHAQEVPLGDHVERVLAWLQPQAQVAGVALAADASLRGWTLRVAPLRLRQLLLNLVGNGIKYGRRGGRVQCCARAGDAPGWLRLEIEDDGLGMSAAQLQRLSHPFERLGREHSGVEGFGLGAYLATQLVHDMGGRITYDSEPGRGTRVRLELPGATAAAPARAPAAAEPCIAAPAGRPLPWAALARRGPGTEAAPLRVLVVDDAPLTPLLLQAQFERVGGVQAQFVGRAQDAVAAWRGAPEPAQLLLLDLNIGDTRGEAVLAALREAGCSAPAVAWTGEVDADAAGRPALHAAGFEEVWVKPLDGDEIARRLARWRRRAQGSQHALVVAGATGHKFERRERA